MSDMRPSPPANLAMLDMMGYAQVRFDRITPSIKDLALKALHQLVCTPCVAGNVEWSRVIM